MSDLDAALLAALEQFAHRSPILVALDFDGCLAPFVLDPAHARPLPAASAALEALGRDPGVQLALVSGRPIADLARLAAPGVGTWLVGSHGAESGEVMPDGGARLAPVALSDAERALLARLRTAIAEIAARFPGTHVELKPAAAALHTRGVPAAEASRALAEAAAGPGTWAGTHLMAGNQVAEVAVVEATKGEALGRLRARLGAAPVLYAGDDVTDETALATLGTCDVGVKVGAAPTVAPHRVRNEQEVAQMLAKLVGLRRGYGRG